MRIQLCQLLIGTSVSVLSVLGGCGDLIPPRPPIRPAQNETAQALSAPEGTDAAAQTTTESLPDEAFEGEWRSWTVHRFGSQVVGINEIVAAPSYTEATLLSGPSEVTYRREERIILRTGRTSFVRRVTLESTEAPDGSLKQIESDVHTGPLVTNLQATLRRGSLNIKTSSGGVQQATQVKCPPTIRGPFAIEQTLRRRPIRKGEIRRMPVLLPSFDAIGLVELRCTGEASVAMLDGRYRLLREVEVMTFREANLIDSLIVWINDEGVIEKSLRPALRLESYRTDQVTARKLLGPLDESSVKVSVKVSVDGVVPEADELSQVTFVIAKPESAEAEDPADASAPAPPTIAGQTVREIEAGFEVRVVAEPDAAAEGEADERKPDPADTRPTKLIDCRQGVVASTAASIGELPVDALASELAHLTQNSLSFAPQGALRPASAIIRSGGGGGIDHAIVLASLLRAREIPARVAFGLADNGPSAPDADDRSTMELAAWVVAQVDGRWVSIDPLTARWNRADQLCLDLPAGAADLNAALIRVFRQVTDIEIEIRDAN